jgi:hypothetical protein
MQGRAIFVVKTMTVLQRFRQCPRWLVVALCFAALAIVSMEFVPHDEVDGRHCLVCKASQQPLQENVAVLVPDQPGVHVSFAPAFEASLTSLPIVDSSSPRAPPA